MVIAGVIIALIIYDILLEVVDSLSLFFMLYILALLATLIWASWKAVSISDIKTIIAYSTISQISYMFLALLVNPFLTLYHIIIHALFKCNLFLICGSLIHVQYHYQSINNIKINHSFIKLIFILSASVLILSLSKETIIYSFILLFNSIFIDLILILGALYTIVYIFNIYFHCFFLNKPTTINSINFNPILI
jgi:NADH-quinone oxidoreductase subunit L